MSGSSSLFTAPTLSSSATAAASTLTANGGTNALSQLSNNYNDFLGLLMTQLKNQDPGSPMDANQFTQELVQFSSVEQQINTNSSLGQLIQLTQQDGLLQSSSLIGKNVVVSNSDMPLQNGKAAISFTAPAAGDVTIAVSDASGNLLSSYNVQASAGSNTWSWNGQNSRGATVPDGDYKVSVKTKGSAASATLAFNVVGTVTGVQQVGGALQLQMGAVSDSVSNVQQVIN